MTVTMRSLNLIILVATIFGYLNALHLISADIYVDDLELVKCNGNSYSPVLVEDIKLHIGQNREIFASGSLFTFEDLSPPLQASVTMKKSTFIGWIPVPCTEDVGSCTYKDLCTYGVPPKKDCPNKFKSNDVPCRCPIAKGNYTLPEINLFTFRKEESILSGKYKGNLLLSHQGNTLACYNIAFTIRDSVRGSNTL